MRKKALLFLLLGMPGLAFADSACESAFATSDNTQVVLTQQVFDGGLQELAIIHQDLTTKQKVTRLSFSGSKEVGCHFPSFALLKGGDWGWHVVWTSSANKGVFYARVDGEAWVSSLPKRLSPELAEQVTIGEREGKLIITVKYPENTKTPVQVFSSEDGGRNWDKALP